MTEFQTENIDNTSHDHRMACYHAIASATEQKVSTQDGDSWRLQINATDLGIQHNLFCDAINKLRTEAGLEDIRPLEKYGSFYLLSLPNQTAASTIRKKAKVFCDLPESWKPHIKGLYDTATQVVDDANKNEPDVIHTGKFCSANDHRAVARDTRNYTICSLAQTAFNLAARAIGGASIKKRGQLVFKKDLLNADSIDLSVDALHPLLLAALKAVAGDCALDPDKIFNVKRGFKIFRSGNSIEIFIEDKAFAAQLLEGGQRLTRGLNLA